MCGSGKVARGLSALSRIVLLLNFAARSDVFARAPPLTDRYPGQSPQKQYRQRRPSSASGPSERKNRGAKIEMSLSGIGTKYSEGPKPFAQVGRLRETYVFT